MESLLLPKKYLSASQMELWEKSPDRYRSEYFEKGKKLRTRYLEFGGYIHKMIEDGTYHEHLPGLRVYSERELRLTAEIRGVPCLSYIDGNDPVEAEFGDYKTGKAAWTQARLQKSEQMLFYAVMLRVRTGKTPTRCGLHWIETYDHEDKEQSFWQDDKQVKLTGRVLTFYRQFDERELDRMEVKILRVAQEISEAYREFINEL